LSRGKPQLGISSFVGIAAMLLAACGSGGASDHDDSSTAMTEMVTPSQVAIEANTLTPPALHGVPEVDSTLAALLSGDAERIRQRVALSEVPCRAFQPQQGDRLGTECPDGVEPGTALSGFWVAEAHAVLLSEPEMELFLGTMAGLSGTLHRVFERTSAGPEASIPLGRYALVLFYSAIDGPHPYTVWNVDADGLIVSAVADGETLTAAFLDQAVELKPVD
jgi:hypothetical protein